jgi:hypothetical protein
MFLKDRFKKYPCNGQLTYCKRAYVQTLWASFATETLNYLSISISQSSGSVEINIYKRTPHLTNNIELAHLDQEMNNIPSLPRLRISR